MSCKCADLDILKSNNIKMQLKCGMNYLTMMCLLIKWEISLKSPLPFHSIVTRLQLEHEWSITEDLISYKSTTRTAAGSRPCTTNSCREVSAEQTIRHKLSSTWKSNCAVHIFLSVTLMDIHSILWSFASKATVPVCCREFSILLFILQYANHDKAKTSTKRVFHRSVSSLDAFQRRPNQLLYQIGDAPIQWETRKELLNTSYQTNAESWTCPEYQSAQVMSGK